jgi:hypothetical protein
MRRFALALLLVAVPTIALAAAMTPSALIAAASTYDGKSVTVTGTVKSFQTSSTPMGTVAGFQLCDSKCVVVIDKTNQSHSNGASATVTGTFHSTFKGPRKTFTNAIVIGH